MGDGSLDAGPQHGERRLQLVTGVGREAPQAQEVPFEAHEHRVECGGEPCELRRVVHLDHPAVEAASVGDGFDLVDDDIYRFEVPPGEHIADDHGREQNEGTADEHAHQQALGIHGRAGRRGTGENAGHNGTRSLYGAGKVSDFSDRIAEIDDVKLSARLRIPGAAGQAFEFGRSPTGSLPRSLRRI